MRAIEKQIVSFNPLNQVYVFNWYDIGKDDDFSLEGFNPLNQVYVFNRQR